MRIFFNHRETSQQVRRRGVTTSTFLFVLPLFAFTVLLVIQWMMLRTSQGDLHRAASAGAQEASLPRASWQSVGEVIRNEVSGLRIASQVDPPMIEINGQAAGATIAPQSGDEIAVSVSVDATAVVPDWLGPIGFTLDRRKLRTRAVFLMP